MTDLATLSGLSSGDRHTSFEDFDARVRAASVGLLGAGVGEGDPVALLMRNDIAFVEATVAIQRLGAIAVPINWHFRSDEVRYILEDCGARMLVAHADLFRQVADAVPEATQVLIAETPQEIGEAYRLAVDDRRVPAGMTGWEHWRGGFDPQDAPPARLGESMIYTSGTTGHPKGVRRGLPDAEMAVKVDSMRAMVYGLRPGARAMITAPMYHSAPNAYVLRALTRRGLIRFLPRFDAETLLKEVEVFRITHAFMTPTMFARMLKLPEAVRGAYDLSSLEFVIHAGAPCPADIKRAMIEWLGPIVNEFYGGTESGPVVFCTSQEWLDHPGTVGRPFEGSHVAIYDDAGNRLPPGGTGEIFMRVGFLPDFTYHDKPEARAEIDRDGLITCGDIGYFDADGFLHICDRKRDMVISGGVNIYPAEIEAVMFQHAAVQDCAVFGIPHAEYGETLMAVVQPVEGSGLTGAELVGFLNGRLAGYKVPRRIEITSHLPREDSGKVFKRKLREDYWKDAGRRI